MKPSDFSADCPGTLLPTEFLEYPNGPFAPSVKTRTWAFVANPLPPKLDWNSIKLTHFDRHALTVSALGKVNGLHMRVGTAVRLLRTLWMREAKLSSEIENIETTAEELVLAGAGRPLGVREAGLESWKYVDALEHGVASTLPFSTRLIKDMHRLLMTGVRGGDRRPGELRDCNVYIGDRSRGVAAARFVPMPPGDGLARAMHDLGTFVNTPHPEIPPLFVIALTHYQFETIHPFSDGNGRIGRVLLSRSLVKEGLLEQPVVYMSAYINEHKQEYVDLLLGISRNGGEYWSRWIGFVLDAIRTQASDAIWRSETLIALRESYQERLKRDGAPARLFQTIDELFGMPAVNMSDLVQRRGVRKPTALADIARLERLGILSEYTGRQRDRDWLARDIVNVIELPSPKP